MKTALIILVVVVLGGAVFWFSQRPAVAPNGTELLTASPTQFITYSPAALPTQTVSPGVSPTKTTSPTTSPKSTPTPTPTPTPRTFIITFANGTANPFSVEIRAGDTVKFVNNDNISHWPASGIHPTHQICPSFDSLRGLNKGESYSFTFNEAKTCPWHDHLAPVLRGQILIQ